MNKLYWLILVIIFSSSTITKADKSIEFSDRYALYNAINFYNNPVDQQIFNYALKGYLNLRDQNKLQKENILSIIDYSQHSMNKRFWVIDLYSQSLLFNEWVSHGKYTGNAYAKQFSNTVNSKQTSLGFFVTGQTYNGKHKYSLKLHGVEPFYNSNAYKRGIVIHGADYVSENIIQAQGKIGRSYGCPAVRQEIKKPLISTIKDGSCLFSFYPDTNYLEQSTLLK